jgi:pyruvate dehydrogenase E2 component (dihydrolipoamide acetyltransferase)
MARWEFKLPDIGEGVTEGEVVGWLVKPGDVVKEDQPMVEIMTDKATVTIAAPKAGTILEARGKVGDIVAVHGVLVVFDLGASASGGATAEAAPKTNGTTSHEDPKKPANRAPQKDLGPAATAVGDIREELPGMRASSSASLARTGESASAAYFNEKPLATPATRRTARELGVDLKAVPPTGTQGRVTMDDVQTYAKNGSSSGNGTTSSRDGRDGPAASEPATQRMQVPAITRDAVKIAPPADMRDGTHGSALEERVPFAGVRRKIAQKMHQSKTTAAHFTFVEECDVSALKALRARMKPQAEALGVKLSFLPFIVKACVSALKKHPILNSALDESTNELVYRKYFHIGIAAATEAGLLVPVIKDADRKSLLDVSKDIDRLAKDARDGKSKASDLTGSTFTITSLGAQGGLFATPIINFPEVAILGVHQIKEKPVVRSGRIEIGEVMLLSLSFDHRIVDGHVGAAFAYDVIGYLENPDRLFLEMA